MDAVAEQRGSSVVHQAVAFTNAKADESRRHDTDAKVATLARTSMANVLGAIVQYLKFAGGERFDQGGTQAFAAIAPVGSC